MIHPVVAYLEAVKDEPGCEAERFVLQHGRVFAGSQRPKGMRGQKVGLCYQNAAHHALDGRGLSYVEGFAMGPNKAQVIKHAWLTSDGTDAIEPTGKSRDASGGYFFGVQFSTRALAELLLLRGYQGLIDPVDEALISAMERWPV
ncbi:hypothetical protein [Microvirga sp. VF16]|uniref:hypothetical protein n=1 Tax=Microvirga sp. VF16 TaxID=2807101 RepID=UPI00193D07D8|nr:hypothetical protein [Microvirga sp. VF16]QRM34455.1 hypothetical protein JO965_35265 [Microvirga sp. VF16]